MVSYDKKYLIQMIVLVLVVAVAAGGLIIFVGSEITGNRKLPTFKGEDLLDESGEFVLADTVWGASVQETFSDLGLVITHAFDVTPADAAEGDKVYHLPKPKAPVGILAPYHEQEMFAKVKKDGREPIKYTYEGEGEGFLEFRGGGFSRVRYVIDYVPRVPFGRDDIIDMNEEFTLNEMGLVFSKFMEGIVNNYGEPTAKETVEKDGITTRTMQWISASGATRLVLQSVTEPKVHGTITISLEKN